MARERQKASSSLKKSSTTKSWTVLSWSDLDDWAGSRSVSRGQAYQRQGRVEDLALAADGRLLATVVGTEAYVTSVWLGSSQRKRQLIDSVCSCPVGASGCKHAVAVVAEYLAALAEKRKVVVAETDDPRWEDLTLDENDDDYGSDRADRGAAVTRRVKRSAAKGGKRLAREDWDQKIVAYIEQKSPDELVEVFRSLVERFPEVRKDIQERIALGDGDVNKLVTAARREIRTVTAEFGWRNQWNGQGHTPDFRPVTHRLEQLIELGHADRVVELGRDLMSRGMEQIGQSNDEGETAIALSDALGVVFDALAKSSLSAPDKLIYAIEACLKDDYDVVGAAAGRVLGLNWSISDWSSVADRLMAQLQKAPRGKGRDDFFQNFQRQRLSDYLLDALTRAKRRAELLPIYEAEARETDSYQRLVDYLIGQKKYEDAKRWAGEGIAKTVEKYPGIASRLTESLCELARREKQWDVVAAHVACGFFNDPSRESFENLEAAASRAKCLRLVRAKALQFLESGSLPISVEIDGKCSRKVTVDPDWPLPFPEHIVTLMLKRYAGRKSQPYFDVLIDMAIKNKQPDEVLRWYEAAISPMESTRGRPNFLGVVYDSDRVAEAITASYPQKAIEIYRRKLDANLKTASTSAYEACAGSLAKMRPIYKSLDQEDHWDELLADIRHNYRNRPRFMEKLERMQGRKAIQSRKTSSRP